MAKVDTLKQLETIDALKKRVQSILNDLEDLRKSIEKSERNAYNPSSANGVTLFDVFEALEKRKHKNARSKLRQLCRNEKISTLDEFLKISPSDFLKYRNIGSNTVYQVREVIESFGIIWSDAT